MPRKAPIKAETSNVVVARSEAKEKAPRRKTPEPVEGITREDVEKAINRIWGPLVPSMLAIHGEMAMEDSKLGFLVREAIFNRYVGMPTQKVDVKEDRHITMIVRPYAEETDDPNVVATQARVLEIEAGSTRPIGPGPTMELGLVDAPKSEGRGVYQIPEEEEDD